MVRYRLILLLTVENRSKKTECSIKSVVLFNFFIELDEFSTIFGQSCLWDFNNFVIFCLSVSENLLQQVQMIQSCFRSAVCKMNCGHWWLQQTVLFHKNAQVLYGVQKLGPDSSSSHWKVFTEMTVRSHCELSCSICSASVQMPVAYMASGTAWLPAHCGCGCRTHCSREVLDHRWKYFRERSGSGRMIYPWKKETEFDQLREIKGGS